MIAVQGFDLALGAVPAKDLELVPHGSGIESKERVRDLERRSRNETRTGARLIVHPPGRRTGTGSLIQDDDREAYVSLREESRPLRPLGSDLDRRRHGGHA